MIWSNRLDAGLQLARFLRQSNETWPQQADLVIALPRGGVPIGFEVARALRIPLSTWSVRKIALPEAPEVAVGAIGPGGIVVWNAYAQSLSNYQRQSLLASEQRELQRRQHRFNDPPPESLEGQGLIVVDDGIATGMTVLAALKSLRCLKPLFLALAVPVVDQSVVAELECNCDHLAALKVVNHLRAVGEFYSTFDQLDDASVLSLLALSSRDFSPKLDLP